MHLLILQSRTHAPSWRGSLAGRLHQGISSRHGLGRDVTDSVVASIFIPPAVPRPPDEQLPLCLAGAPPSCLLRSDRNELLNFGVVLSSIHHIRAATSIAKADCH